MRVPRVAVAVGAVFLGGLALRLFWVEYTDSAPIGGDPRWYLTVALNLTLGYGYVSNSNPSVLFGELVRPGDPTAFWPPAYPIVLAGFWKLSGVGLDSAKVMNAILAALAIPFVYGIGRKLFDPKAALLAAGLFAVLPNAIVWTPLILSEHLFIPLFAAALWVLVTFPVTSKTRWAPLVAFGLLTGVAMLTRGQGTVLVPVAFTYWLLRGGVGPALRSTGIALLAAVAIISPWTVRNWVEMHAFIPISTNAGVVLRTGHAPDATGTTYWTQDVIDGFTPEQSLYDPEREVKGYREYTRRAIGYAFTHPARELELTRAKIYHTYRPEAEMLGWLTTLDATPLRPEGLKGVLEHVVDYGYYALVFGAVASVPLWFRRTAEGSLLVSIVFFWTAFHVVFQGEPRYHLPLLPIFCLAVGGGVWLLPARIASVRAWWRQQRTVPGEPLGEGAAPWEA